MGLNEVKNEILQTAKRDADAILSGAHKEILEIKGQTEKEIVDYTTKVEEDTVNLISTMERKETSAAAFDTKKALLDKKKMMIDKVFEKVQKKLLDLNQKKREDIIKKLIVKAGKEIDVSVVYANSADKSIISKMKEVSYKESDISGGIIAETADGRIRIDYSYEELLGSIKKDALQEIAALLFDK